MRSWILSENDIHSSHTVSSNHCCGSIIIEITITRDKKPDIHPSNYIIMHRTKIVMNVCVSLSRIELALCVSFRY